MSSSSGQNNFPMRERDNSELQLPSVTLGPCSYLLPYLFEKLHCVHIVCHASEGFVLHFMK